MTNPAAVVPLTYDGVDLQELDFTLFLEIAKGLDSPPGVRGRDQVIPKDEGRWAMLRRSDMLPIQLVGIVCGDDTLSSRLLIRQSHAVMRELVRDLFHPARDPAPLVATLEDGTVKTIDARPLPDVLWTPHPGHDHLDIKLDGYGDWSFVAGSGS
jgi:hypothetical protein